MDDIQKKLPLNPVVYSILLILMNEQLHGFDIKQRVEIDIQKDIATATLYRYLRRMDREGLIKEVPPKESDDQRRIYYTITGLGSTVCKAEYKRYQDIYERRLVLNPVLKGV
ncbi:MAG: PadR family transcriptional regulator [Chloroflexota bacterium]